MRAACRRTRAGRRSAVTTPPCCGPSGRWNGSNASPSGSGPTFALLKHYTSGAQSWTRAIAKPVTGTVRIALGGVEQPSGWSVDTATGVVTFMPIHS
ncbi:DUF2460 domain-containing protein [Lacimonas salitolerans]|uniref:DUF2460 domain-containing protein n=1 Tax=Lacimonas salitolerans TaxID=1323750 RepID=A0ABW4EH22_9RHOB